MLRKRKDLRVQTGAKLIEASVQLSLAALPPIARKSHFEGECTGSGGKCGQTQAKCLDRVQESTR